MVPAAKIQILSAGSSLKRARKELLARLIRRAVAGPGRIRVQAGTYAPRSEHLPVLAAANCMKHSGQLLDPTACQPVNIHWLSTR